MFKVTLKEYYSIHEICYINLFKRTNIIHIKLKETVILH